MDIVLTQKDADWIANVIREHIQLLGKDRDEALEECNGRYKMCLSLAKLADVDPTDEESGESLETLKNKTIENINNVYYKGLNEYERILELMMCGSS